MSYLKNQENDLSLLSNEIHRIEDFYCKKIDKYENSFLYNFLYNASMLSRLLALCSGVWFVITAWLYLEKNISSNYMVLSIIIFLGTFIFSQLDAPINPEIKSKSKKLVERIKLLSTNFSSSNNIKPKRFFNKIIKIKESMNNYILKKIFFKNQEEIKEINNLDSLINDFYTKFTPDIKNLILNFYENNPYKFGTPENIALNNSYQKIKKFFEHEDYIEVFSIYQNDKTKYAYDSMEKYY